MFSLPRSRRLSVPVLAAGALLCVLCACTETTGANRAFTLSPSKGVSAGERVQTQPGDTVYSVARRYGVSMRDVIALNKLQAPFSLSPGMALVLPARDALFSTPQDAEKPRPNVEIGPLALDKDTYAPYQETSAVRGKKVYEQVAPQLQSTAPAAGTDGESVIYADAAPRGPLNLVPPQDMRSQKLEAQLQTQNEPPAKEAAKAEKPVSALPTREKDTTKKPEAVRNALAEQLNLKPLVYDKQKKHLRAPVPAAKSQSAPVAAEEEKGPVMYTAPAATPKETPLYKKSELGLKPLQEPKDDRRPSFIWPVQGPVLSTYGPKSNGMKNDGINIGAPRGTPVVAADGGTVAYAGSDIPGYGNVVLVRHPSGLMTTYAHLERMFVQADSVVAKGDMVGSVGTSGGMDTPQLHFEIRRGNEALDPSKQLYGK